VKKKITLQNAVRAVDRAGACLVYPLAGRKDPASLWHSFFPRKAMRWEWSEEGADDSVAEMWHLRERLSRSEKVVYAKWFKGRATFFSREVFVWLLAYLQSPEEQLRNREAIRLYEILREHSPLSTKRLKKYSDLQGKFFEATFSKALRELWEKLLIVGWGEVDDGAFPSLNVGCSRDLFEDLWQEATKFSSDQAAQALEEFWGRDNLFWRYAEKLRGPRANSFEVYIP
jgi:hypothetical protein